MGFKKKERIEINNYIFTVSLDPIIFFYYIFNLVQVKKTNDPLDFMIYKIPLDYWITGFFHLG